MWGISNKHVSFNMKTQQSIFPRLVRIFHITFYSALVSDGIDFQEILKGSRKPVEYEDIDYGGR